ncbi:MAG: MamI family restriction endonuclease [Kiritimatiellia bacterium]
MQPKTDRITLRNNREQIQNMLMQLVLHPRRDFIRWAKITKQTPNMKIGYPGQHLASLITGMEGERTGARGNDLCDGSEVKSCSRIDQLDKCKDCDAAVARIEPTCPQCHSTSIQRNHDSKWLFAIKSEKELQFLLDQVPRVVLILADCPNFDQEDWDTIQFQAFEIWPKHERHKHFRTLMTNYFNDIYLPHIQKNAKKTPAPKNFWPYSFQSYMCNPILTFHCVITHANAEPSIDIKTCVEPERNRADINPVMMPLDVLIPDERKKILEHMDPSARRSVEERGLNEEQRVRLSLRDTDHATPQSSTYRRGVRSY